MGLIITIVYLLLLSINFSCVFSNDLTNISSSSEFNKTIQYDRTDFIISTVNSVLNSTEISSQLFPILSSDVTTITESIELLNSNSIDPNITDILLSNKKVLENSTENSSEDIIASKENHNSLDSQQNLESIRFKRFNESNGNGSEEEQADQLLMFDNFNDTEYEDEFSEIEEERRESLMAYVFNEIKANKDRQTDLTPDQKFIDMISKIKNLYNMVMKDLTPLIIEQILTANITVECMNGLVKAYGALNNNEQWVFQMLDSNGHFPSGLMSGTLTSLGDYDQCLNTENIEYGIRGQYCLLKIKPELPKKKGIITFKDRFISLNGTEHQNTWIDSLSVKSLYNFYYLSITNGICVPSTCNKNDLGIIARQFLSPLNLEIEIENCAQKTETLPDLNTGQKLAVLVLSGFISLAVLATILENIFIANYYEFRNIFIQFVKCFSLRQNLNKFFDTTVNHKSHTFNLKFFDGIKVLSIIWVIIGHTYISGAIFFSKDIPAASFYSNNLEDTINLPKQLFTQFVINALLGVDTFFFVSGFLIVYLSVVKVVEQNQTISFKLFMFLRWIRFTPMIIAMISMNLLWPLLGSGPLFHENYTKFMTDPCYTYWWRNLLFISNWYPPEEQCMIHTWYMSADFQFYVLAFLIIKLACSNPNCGMMISSALVFAGIIISTGVGYCSNLPPTILYQADIENMALQTSLMHYKSYNHLTTFFSGCFMGCLLLKKQNITIKPVSRLCLWVFTCFSLLFVIFITYVWASLEWEYSRLGAALYFGTHRFVWSLGLSWIVFNCAQNKGGIVNTILSSGVFKLLSRLTFSIYLSHMLIIWFNFFRTKHLFRSTHYDMLFTTSGVFVFTLILAFINHIIFETPVANLIKLVIDSNRLNKKNSNQINGNKFTIELKNDLFDKNSDNLNKKV